MKRKGNKRLASLREKKVPVTASAEHREEVVSVAIAPGTLSERKVSSDCSKAACSALTDSQDCVIDLPASDTDGGHLHNEAFTASMCRQSTPEPEQMIGGEKETNMAENFSCAAPVALVKNKDFDTVINELQLRATNNSEVKKCVNNLILVAKGLKNNNKMLESELLSILESTVEHLKNPQVTTTAYVKQAKQVQGSASVALQVLGGLMLALATATAITVVTAFVLPTAPIAASVLGCGIGASAFGFFAGAGAMYCGRSTGLSKSMLDLDSAIKQEPLNEACLAGA